MCANGQLDIPFSAASDSLRETPESPVKRFICFSLKFTLQRFVKVRHLSWCYKSIKGSITENDS